MKLAPYSISIAFLVCVAFAEGRGVVTIGENVIRQDDATRNDSNATLSEKLRKQIFAEIVSGEDKAAREAEKKSPNAIMNSRKYREEFRKSYKDEIQKKYGISEARLKQIYYEGIDNNWSTQKPIRSIE